jgi:NADH-quinone oxidoreductase subunit J
VLLTRGADGPWRASAFSPGWVTGLAITGLLLACLVLPVLMSPSLKRLAPPSATAPVADIGRQLMTRYALPLETAGLLLTAALVGAVIIALDETRPVPPPADQSLPRRKPQLEESPR